MTPTENPTIDTLASLKDEQQEVWITTATGKTRVFHASDPRDDGRHFAKGPIRKAQAISLAEARERGLAPCDRCYRTPNQTSKAGPASLPVLLEVVDVARRLAKQWNATDKSFGHVPNLGAELTAALAKLDSLGQGGTE